MKLEDRIAIGALAVVFIGVSAAGYALGGSHPALNGVAFLIGIACWWLAVEGP